MCDPITITTTALAVASSATSLYSQSVMADAQTAALEEQAKAQGEELSAQRNQALGERVKQGRAERSRMQVAAGEAGLQVSSGSTGVLALDSFLQENIDKANIVKQSSFNERAANARFKSAASQIDKPDLLTGGLQIATAGFNGYQSGLQIKNAKNAGKS